MVKYHCKGNADAFPDGEGFTVLENGKFAPGQRRNGGKYEGKLVEEAQGTYYCWHNYYYLHLLEDYFLFYQCI